MRHAGGLEVHQSRRSLSANPLTWPH